MTTIAYKDGIISYDSRASTDYYIISDNLNKKIERDGIIFFIAGDAGDFDKIIEFYSSEKTETYLRFQSIVVDNGEVFVFCADEGISWKINLKEYDYYAVGSGTPYALAAMDLGCSSREAVSASKKRDLFTGGRVKTYNVRA